MAEECSKVLPLSLQDSCKPLSAMAHCLTNLNAPGTSGFVWKRKDPFICCHWFKTNPGVKDAFLTQKLWDTMARETNVEQRPITLSSHMKTWVNTTEEELQSFTGLCQLMGLQLQPHLQYY